MKFQRKKLLLVAASLLILGLVGGSLAWSQRCSDSCYASVGSFNSYATGTQLALQKISQQIRSCPKAVLYVAHYDVLAKGTKVDDVSIKYEPSSGILVYEPDNSAEIQLWRKVNVQLVHAVALSSGNLSDFKKYGCYRTR